MNMKKLDKAIDEAAKKLGQPFNPSKYSGDYKYWSGLHDARNIILGNKSAENNTSPTSSSDGGKE